MEKFQLVAGLDAWVVGAVEIPLKIRKRDLVGWLKFSIILMVLLNGIIGEMHKFIAEILHIKLFGSRSNIPILKPIALLIPVDTTYTNVGAYIEFTLLVEEGHDVLLNDVSANSSHFINFIFLDNISNLFDSLNHLNVCSTISIFTRLHEPSVSLFWL